MYFYKCARIFVISGTQLCQWTLITLVNLPRYVSCDVACEVSGDVTLQSMKSYCSQSIDCNAVHDCDAVADISLKFCTKKNVTATVNLFVNFWTKTGNRRGLDHLIKKIDELDLTAQKSGSGRLYWLHVTMTIWTMLTLIWYSEDIPYLFECIHLCEWWIF